MKYQKGDVLTEKHGAKVELLSRIHEDGTATVKVLNPGTFLEAKKGTVLRGFAITYGCLLRFQ